MAANGHARPQEVMTELDAGSMTHLERLEAESIQIMREVVAEAENPVMLYSIGKDSSAMLHLAMKAFFPAEAAESRSCQNDTSQYEHTPTPSQPTNITSRLFARTSSTIENTNRLR